MSSKTKKLPLHIMLLLLGGLLISCKSEPTLAPPVAPGIVVGITDGTCPGVIVNVGDQVTWNNQGKEDHIVQLIDGEGVSQFSSGVLIPGDSFSMTFSEPITYTYSCSAIGSMKGIVTVNP